MPRKVTQHALVRPQCLHYARAVPLPYPQLQVSLGRIAKSTPTYLPIDITRDNVSHVWRRGDAASVSRIEVPREAFLLVQLEAVLRTKRKNLRTC